MDDISDELQCPVCLLIPREGPIPACPAGHIVCKDCRVNVTTCPTCRRPMNQDGTNTLASKMIEKVPHPCKYGCQVKNYLKEIKEHETRCPERTVKCPHLGCNDMVKVSEFGKHAMSNKNCIIYSYFTRRTPCLFKQGYLFSTGYCFWPTKAFEDHGKLFFFHRHFCKDKHIFAFYVTLLSGEAEKYLAKIKLTNPFDDRKSLSLAENVISIDSAPRNNEEVMASKNVIFVHWRTISRFMMWRKSTENGKQLTVSDIETSIDILNT